MAFFNFLFNRHSVKRTGKQGQREGKTCGKGLRGDSNPAGHWHVIARLKITGALMSRFNKNKTKTSKQTKKRHKKEMQKIILHAQKYYFHLRSILLVNNQSNIFILRTKKQFHDHQF